MAQKARKELAKANMTTLRNLHAGSAVVNALFLFWSFVVKPRSLFWWFLLSLPSFACQFALEQTGRPRYDSNGSLRSPGEDLAAQGLMEYMFDVIWVTWASAVLVMFLGNGLWYLWLVVPAFAAYKGYGMLRAARQMAGMSQFAGDGAAPPTNRKERRAAASKS